MLNGIGGITIKQAKENLTHAEALQWAEYMRVRGSFNLGRRIDRGFALLTSWLLKVNGQDADMEDFLPATERFHKEKVATPNDVLHLFKAISKRNEQLKQKRVK